MKQKLCLLVLSLLLSIVLLGNNVRIDGSAKVISVNENQIATVSLVLQWDHSWRDAYNWDGVWLFLKYKSADGVWKHAYLETDPGHEIDNAFTYDLGMSQVGGANKAVGMMLHKSAPGAMATATVNCKLKWKLPDGVNIEMFNSHRVSVMAQAIEMVYVPYGAYYLGDSYSDKSFSVQLIEGEGAQTVKDSTDSYSLSAAYPKGYDGFYQMKYEVSQEQYASFLNTLTREQQVDLLSQSLLSMEEREYIFGSKSDGYKNPVSRNGIVMSWGKLQEPYVFGNNLTNDVTVNNTDNDGQTVACNFMSVRDMVAYLSWCGLRPMTELEYEKSCRRPYPNTPVKGEYAWNHSNDLAAAGAVSGMFGSNETVGSGNANYADASLGGPLRCGVFAKSDSRQHEAGSSYWGAMEMSGNLRELCINTKASSFSRDKHGDGSYNTSYWSNGASDFGVRGGGFSSSGSELRIADRSQIGYVKDISSRDASVGFRGVRSFVPNVQINPGTIIPKGSSTSVCPEVPLHIGGEVASVDGQPSLNFRYNWYVNGKLIPYESGPTLTYDAVEAWVESYTFIRKAICALGEASTSELKFVTTQPLKLNITTDTLFCSKADVIIAERNVPSTHTWYAIGSRNDTIRLQEKPDVAKSQYIPNYTNFGYEEGNYTIYCVSSAGGFCKNTATVALKVESACQLASSSDTVVMGQSVKLSMCVAGQIRRIYNGSSISMGNNITECTFTPSILEYPQGNELKFYDVMFESGIGTCSSEKKVVVKVEACRIQVVQDTVRLGLTAENAVAIVSGKKSNISWKYAGYKGGAWQLGAENTNSYTFTPTFDIMGLTKGNYTVYFKSEIGTCSSLDSVIVKVEWGCGVPLAVSSLYPAGTDLGGKTSYNTVQIGTQCWMSENLNVGGFSNSYGSNYNLHNIAGIQRICYNNDVSYCGVYGGLYSWQESVNGGNTGDPAYKYVSGSTTMVQGICPDGWHMPSDEEFKVMERYLGMAESEVIKDNAWRGTDEGLKLKANKNGTDVMQGQWSNATGAKPAYSDSKNVGFNGLPGGYREWSGYTTPGATRHVGQYGIWWSATPSGSLAINRQLTYTEAKVLRYANERSHGFSVRCLRN